MKLSQYWEARFILNSLAITKRKGADFFCFSQRNNLSPGFENRQREPTLKTKLPLLLQRDYYHFAKFIVYTITILLFT